MLKRGVLIAALLSLAAPAAAQDKQPPYWASMPAARR